MHLNQEERASRRGERIAFYWKFLKRNFFHLNHKFVSWATNHNMPGWVGNIPAVLLFSLVILAFILCGMLIAGSALLLGGLVFVGSALLSREGANKFLI